jgi:hypothetical protein
MEQVTSLSRRVRGVVLSNWKPTKRGAGVCTLFLLLRVVLPMVASERSFRPTGGLGCWKRRDKVHASRSDRSPRRGLVRQDSFYKVLSALSKSSISSSTSSIPTDSRIKSSGIALEACNARGVLA